MWTGVLPFLLLFRGCMLTNSMKENSAGNSSLMSENGFLKARRKYWERVFSVPVGLLSEDTIDKIKLSVGSRHKDKRSCKTTVGT